MAGYDDMSPSNHNGYAEYVDPRNNFAMSRGNAFMPEARGYHTVTVLLPDGRVLVGSGNVDGNDAIERTDFRYYYPDYMFKTRPQIVSAPATLDIGGSAYIAVPYRQALGEVALVGLGLMTHSFDMNQRHVQVEASATHSSIRFVSGAWVLAGAAECDGDPASCLDVYSIYAPRAREIAPPGHYMLFILDNNRVPSTGAMVRVQ